MSSRYPSSRSPRRSPRSRQGRNNGSYGPRSSKNRGRKPKAPQKVSFLTKVLSIFGLGNSSKKTSSKPSATKGSNHRRSARKPEITEVTTPRLYIGNLSFDATESDLFELFSGIGNVQNVELISYHDTQRSKGFGFVQMTSIEEAKRAVTELHDKEYMGRKLVVSGARAIPENRSENRAEARSEDTCCTTTPEETASEETSCCHTPTDHSSDAEEGSCCHHG